MGTVTLKKKDEFAEDAKLTVEQVKSLVPRAMKQNITPELVRTLNDIAEDPELRAIYRENVIGYMDVLQEPNISLKAYLAAVKYVSYKLMDKSNEAAWMMTFPERYQRMVDEDKGHDAIRAAVSAYNKGKIVNMVLERSLVPTWVLNSDIHQKAINHLAHLMKTAKSEKVQGDAASSLLTHLKPPESKKIDLEIGYKEDDSLRVMKNALAELANAKRKQIEDGDASAGEIAASRIIDVTPEIE